MEEQRTDLSQLENWGFRKKSQNWVQNIDREKNPGRVGSRVRMLDNVPNRAHMDVRLNHNARSYSFV